MADSGNTEHLRERALERLNSDEARELVRTLQRLVGAHVAIIALNIAPSLSSEALAWDQPRSGILLHFIHDGRTCLWTIG